MAGNIKVGVVGIGNFARAQHVPNLSRMPGIELRALCDTDEAVLRDVADLYNVPKQYQSFQAMLDDSQIDALVLTVRDDLQAEMAILGLERGLDVYVEKPLSRDPKTCGRVAACSESSPGRLAVGYNKRFAPMYAKTREIITKYGPARMIHLAMTDDAWRWARGYEPGYLLVLDVCHHFDLVEWLTDSAIESVTCRSSGQENDAMLVETASGCVATILFSGTDSMDAPKEYARIIGDRFSLTGEDYVELFVHGIPEEPQSYRFAGHIQDGNPYLHRRLMKQQGISGWRDIRRIAWDLFRESSGAESSSDPLERPFIPNFIRDQGWFSSLQTFLTPSSPATDHADARDAQRIARVTAAALRSRQNGTTERVVTDG